MAAFPAFPAFPAYSQQYMLPGNDPLCALADLDDIFDQEEFDKMMDDIGMDFTTTSEQPAVCAASQVPAYEPAPAYTVFGDLSSSANTMLFAMLEQRASLFSPPQFQLPVFTGSVSQPQEEYSPYAPTPFTNVPGSTEDEDYSADRSSVSASSMAHSCNDCGKTFTCASKVRLPSFPIIQCL